MKVRVSSFARRGKTDERFDQVKTNCGSDKSKNTKKFHGLKATNNACKIVSDVVELLKKAADIFVVM